MQGRGGGVLPRVGAWSHARSLSAAKGLNHEIREIHEKRPFSCPRIVSVDSRHRGPSMVLGSPDGELKQIKVNAYGARGLQHGPSRGLHVRI